MAGVGRLLVGGGAVLLGYTITNNALNKVTKLKIYIFKLFPVFFVHAFFTRLQRRADSPPEDWTRDVEGSLEGNRPLAKRLFTV